MNSYKNPGSRLGLNLDRIEAALRRGESIKKICKRYKCQQATIYRIARARGVPPRYRRFTGEEFKAVVAALKAGKLHREIVAELGVKPSMVESAARKAGLRRNPRKELPVYAMERAYELGQSCEQIGEALGISPESVRTALRKRGHDTTEWGRCARLDQLRDCVRAKMNGLQAAKKFGAKPTGCWYRRWRKAKEQVREGKV